MNDNNIRKLADTILDVIEGKLKKKPQAYDTQAVVRRVDPRTGTAYVHIPNGVDETPVRLTIDAEAGDTVQVRVADGRAWLTGNRTAPPTDDAEAIEAKIRADLGVKKAEKAQDTADTAQIDAARARDAADSAEQSAQDAQTAAGRAQTAAENASDYAARALGNLSTVQSVAETLTWITAHGTMALTTDVALDPTHVYFVLDPAGDYTVGGQKYAIVTEPDVADIATYYELTIDESLNNYVGTHLAVDGEGLWLLPAASGTNKVLIATGAGSTYTTAGTYIIDALGNTAASFRADGATMSAQGVLIAHLGYGPGKDSGGGTTNAPYYTLGGRNTSNPVGNYSVAEGEINTASGCDSHAEGVYSEATGNWSHAEGESAEAAGDWSHAEGFGSQASGDDSHAEGSQTTASGDASHAEGLQSQALAEGAHAEGSTAAGGMYSHSEGQFSEAAGKWSHAGGYGTLAGGNAQTAIGAWNDNKAGDLFEVGNGTADNARSNALELTDTGDLTTAGDITDGGGNVLANKADSSSLAAVATSGDYGDLLNKPTIPTVNDATLTIQKNGTTVETFTANASANKTANITVPTQASDIGAQPTLTSSTDITVKSVKIGDHTTAIGSTLTARNTSTVSVPTSTATDICSISLPKGVWVVACGLRWPANTTGHRCGKLHSTSKGITATNADVITFAQNMSGTVYQMQWTKIIEVTAASQTWYLEAFQNSGSTLTMPTGSTQTGTNPYGSYIHAVRIA